jgi:flavin-dependent dehydrogenase
MKIPARVRAVVVGGGPAGCAVALRLARAGSSCVVVERSGARQFQIGETLRPSARRSLSRLGVADAFLAEGHLPSHAIASSWGSEELQVDNRLFDPQGPGWHLDRARFDTWIRGSAAQAGAFVLEDARLQACGRRTEGWEVVVTDSTGEHRTHADVVVDATGASASIARRHGARRHVYDRMVGWSRVFEGAPTSDGFLLVEAAADGWWYSVPLPGGGLLVVLVTAAPGAEAATAAGWSAQLASTVHTRGRVPRATAERPRAWSIVSARLDRCAGRGWLAVGDAAATYDPLAAVGVEKALRTGADAAEAIVAGTAAWPDYVSAVDEDFERYLSLRCAHYCAESRWPLSPFWRRRRQKDPAQAEVWLPPHAALTLADDDRTRVPEEVATLISPSEWATLRQVFEHGSVAAHAGAAALRPHGANRHGDRRIVVALERMLGHGTLRRAPL